ncbi:MAG: CBS domain-containing protein, partial [Candidatus Zixiibacteriota bacterium]
RIVELMEKNNVHHIPFIRGEKVVGLISLRDIYRTKIKGMETEIRYLMDMLHKRDKSGDQDLFHRSNGT